MTRDEFMKELAYLLQDIQEEDKEDAVQYYMDYFDEAGPEQESEVIRELGSPERISAIIRADIDGHLEKGGEFTESGYQDERFRDPNYQVAKRFDLPEKQEEGGGQRGGPQNREAWQKDRQGTGPWNQGTWQKGGPESGQNQTPPRTSLLLKVILWIILIIVAGPILLGLGGGALGIVIGIGAAILGVLLFTGVITIVMTLCGTAMIPFGIVYMFTQSLDGFFMSGVGLIFLGIGILLISLSVLFYGKFIPFLIRGIVDTLHRLLHKRRCSS